MQNSLSLWLKIEKIMFRTASFSLLLLCALGFTACQSDKKVEATVSPTTILPDGNNPDGVRVYEAGSPDIPRPAGCNFISDAVLQDILGGEEAQPISFSNGPAEASCVYRLETKYWYADLLIEVGDGSRASGMLLEIDESTPAELTTLNGHKARMRNDNRIFNIAAQPPHVIKLSVIAKPGYNEIVDSAKRRQLIEAISRVLEDNFKTN